MCKLNGVWVKYEKIITGNFIRMIKHEFSQYRSAKCPSRTGGEKTTTRVILILLKKKYSIPIVKAQ